MLWRWCRKCRDATLAVRPAVSHEAVHAVTHFPSGAVRLVIAGGVRVAGGTDVHPDCDDCRQMGQRERAGITHEPTRADDYLLSLWLTGSDGRRPAGLQDTEEGVSVAPPKSQVYASLWVLYMQIINNVISRSNYNMNNLYNSQLSHTKITL